MATWKKIGTFTLENDNVFVEFFECARWWRKVAVKAGTYDVISDGTIYNIRMPGHDAGSDFTSSLGGFMGDPKVNTEIGNFAIYVQGGFVKDLSLIQGYNPSY